MLDKRMHIYVITLTILLLHIMEVAAEGKRSVFSFSIFTGPQFGGINEIRDIDAITSATKAGGKAGVRIELKAKRYFIVETGLEYLFFNQELTYRDAPGNYYGERRIFFHQLRIPLTYNLHFSENKRNDPMGVLRLGPYLGFLLPEKTEDEGNVPNYTAKRIDGGIVIAGLLCPFVIGTFASVGIFLDMQRGFSLFWEDPHHDGEGFGEGKTSAMSIGLLLKF